jgi:hypothetical protein
MKLSKAKFSQFQNNSFKKLVSVYEVYFDPSNITVLTLLKLKLEKLEANHEKSIESLKLEFHIRLPELSEVKQLMEHGLLLPSESQDSNESPSASDYDFSIQSGGTRPSTVPTSVPSAPPHTSGTPRGTDLATSEEYQFPSNCLDIGHGLDTATIYSIETLADDPKLHYFQVFVDQLAEDVKTGADGMALRDLGPDYLDHALKEFACKLHEESSNPFQLETSVIIHRKRRYVD